MGHHVKTPFFLSGSILNGKQKQAVGAGERLGYACQVTKYDRHGYSARQRTLVVTDTACYVLDSSGKLKDHIRHDNLTGEHRSLLLSGSFSPVYFVGSDVQA